MAVAVVEAGSCSSHSTPSLGTSICLGEALKSRKKKKKKKVDQKWYPTATHRQTDGLDGEALQSGTARIWYLTPGSSCLQLLGILPKTGTQQPVS